MEKSGKLIKIICALALLLAVFSLSWFFCQNFEFSGKSKVSLFLPVNKKKAEIELAENEKKAKILFVGDLMLDRHVKEKIAAKGLPDLFQGLEKSKFDFFRYDLVSANLEGAVTDGGGHYLPAYGYDFAFAPEVIGELKNYNLKVFNLANNHFTDQGERGLNETRVNLKELGDDYYGCADGEAGGCSATVYLAGDLKIGFAGYSAVYRKFDMAEAGKIVADLADKTDLVAVNIHWGVEYEHVYNKTQEEMAHKLIDAGADIIIGHHPHVVQGLEIYQGKPIFYSLGNFIFDQYFSRDTQEELAVELEYEASGRVKLVLYPLISKQSQPNLMTGEEREKYLEKIAGWSSGDDELKQQIKKGEIAISL